MFVSYRQISRRTISHAIFVLLGLHAMSSNRNALSTQRSAVYLYKHMVYAFDAFPCRFYA